ncbi:hypothetical protein JCM10207_000012 [Rhodosporidiobolus poonsookiae]
MAAPPSLSHLQWRAPEFLLAFGQLSTPQLAAEYFSLSPFFDKSSNNAQLRMQMMFSRGGMEGVDEEAELRRFVGTEYVVAHSAPPDLFILHKRTRTSPVVATVTSAYYILNGNVYQAPTLFDVLNERVLTSIHAISTSLSDLTALKPSWTPETLYSWDIKPPPASAAALPTTADEGAGEEAGVEPSEGQAMGTKRAREDGSADGVGASAGEGGEEGEGAAKREKPDAPSGAGTAEAGEDDERPPEAFNPLLFRALQSVARGLEREEMEAQRAEAGEGGA